MGVIYTMSVVALKRKTGAKYNNVSVSTIGFSLNGTRRNQGYVGQTSHGRALSFTPMKSNVPRGHGGCCDTYKNSIVSPNICCLNDSSVVKTSSINTNGYISKTFQCIIAGADTTVKPDNTQNENTQSAYTKYVAKKAINETINCVNPPTYVNNCPTYNAQLGTKICNINKDESEYSSIKQSEFISILSRTCINNDTFTVPTAVCRVPVV